MPTHSNSAFTMCWDEFLFPSWLCCWWVLKAGSSIWTSGDHKTRVQIGGPWAESRWQRLARTAFFEKHKLACLCGRNPVPLLHSLSHTLLSPVNIHAQPCSSMLSPAEKTLLYWLYCHLIIPLVCYHIDAILALLLFMSHSPMAAVWAFLNI